MFDICPFDFSICWQFGAKTHRFEITTRSRSELDEDVSKLPGQVVLSHPSPYSNDISPNDFVMIQCEEIP